MRDPALPLSTVSEADPEGLIPRAWPEIPADMRDVVETLTTALHRERGQDLSAEWEARLAELAQGIVARAISEGAGVGVAPLASRRLAGDPGWRQEVEWAVMVRAS